MSHKPLRPAALGVRLDALRELTCLAHTVGGVTLRLNRSSHLADDGELLVSYACLGADLSPCQLRAALIYDDLHSPGRLSGGFATVEVVAGLAPLGGGIYQRAHPGAATERWFVTTLAADQIEAAISAFPDTGGFRAVIKPDMELGVNAVCISAEADVPVIELDELTVAVLGAVLVDELTAHLA